MLINYYSHGIGGSPVPHFDIDEAELSQTFRTFEWPSLHNYDTAFIQSTEDNFKK